MKIFLNTLFIIVASTLSLVGQFTLNTSGAAFTPSEIGVNVISTLEFNYQVPGTAPSIPIGAAKISIDFPTNNIESAGSEPYGSNAQYFDWTYDEGTGMYVGINNVLLSNSIFANTNGGVISIDIVSIADSDGNAVTTNINPGEVNFPPSVSGSGTSAEIIVNSILPVEYLYFSSKGNNCESVNLVWATASEVNNRGFYVERSEDGGKKFENIDFVKGGVNALATNRYSYVDDIARVKNKSSIFYKLRQEDLDGKYDFSELLNVSVLDCEVVLLSLYPNPARISTKLEIKGWDTESSFSYKVINSIGAVIMNEIIDGDGEVKIDLEKTPMGLYKVIVDYKNQIYTKSVIRIK